MGESKRTVSLGHTTQRQQTMPNSTLFIQTEMVEKSERISVIVALTIEY